MNWTYTSLVETTSTFSGFFYITSTISQSARCHTGHLSDMMRSNAFCSHPIGGWSPIGGAHPPGLNPSNAKNSNLHFLAPSYFSPTGSPLSPLYSPYFNFWDWDYDRPLQPHWVEALFCEILPQTNFPSETPQIGLSFSPSLSPQFCSFYIYEEALETTITLASCIQL